MIDGSFDGVMPDRPDVASVFAVTIVHAMGIYMHLFAATTKYTWRGGEGFPGSDVRPL